MQYETALEKCRGSHLGLVDFCDRNAEHSRALLNLLYLSAMTVLARRDQLDRGWNVSCSDHGTVPKSVQLSRPALVGTLTRVIPANIDLAVQGYAKSREEARMPRLIILEGANIREANNTQLLRCHLIQLIEQSDQLSEGEHRHVTTTLLAFFNLWRRSVFNDEYVDIPLYDAANAA